MNIEKIAKKICSFEEQTLLFQYQPSHNNIIMEVGLLFDGTSTKQSFNENIKGIENNVNLIIKNIEARGFAKKRRIFELFIQPNKNKIEISQQFIMEDASSALLEELKKQGWKESKF